MPIYLYKCPVCATRQDIVKPLAELDREEGCPRCANAMLRQICAPAVHGDLEGYDCPITGARIEGRRAHEENLRKHGCRVLEPGESDEVRRRQQDEEQKLDSQLDESIGRAITALPTEKLDRLKAEMDHGLGLDVVRSTVK